LNNLDYKAQHHIGIHISGSNAGKTALISLQGHLLHAPLKLASCHERIVNLGRHSSDERLVALIGECSDMSSITVDCPLALPPCLACTRPSCPSVTKCEDIEVASMIALSAEWRKDQKRKTKPVNPQTTRLWDLQQLVSGRVKLEPAFGVNTAPLAARARTLAKRLSGAGFSVPMRELSVPLALASLRESLGLPDGLETAYRSFEFGADTREAFVLALMDEGWLDADAEWESVMGSVELFQAFVAAFCGQLAGHGLQETAQRLAFIDILQPELHCDLTRRIDAGWSDSTQ
jgi:hypothetical protein